MTNDHRGRRLTPSRLEIRSEPPDPDAYALRDSCVPHRAHHDALRGPDAVITFVTRDASPDRRVSARRVSGRIACFSRTCLAVMVAGVSSSAPHELIVDGGRHR